jgi:hypothetical protein
MDFKCIEFFDNIILNKLNNIDCWVAGGALRDYYTSGMLLEGTDVDVFFKSKEDFDEAIKLIEQYNFPLEQSTNDTILYDINGILVHFIRKIYYKDVISLINDFDFTVCCAAVGKSVAFATDEFFRDIAKKKLVIKTLNTPLSTLKRTYRYTKRGYTISDGELFKLILAVRSADLGDETKNPFFHYGNPETSKIEDCSKVDKETDEYLKQLLDTI